MKKYELTNETKLFNGVTLHRIKALKDFGNVKKCDLGGYVEMAYKWFVCEVGEKENEMAQV